MSDASEVKMTLETASLGPEFTKELQDKLRALGIETSEQYFAMLSADPPRWIELIGTIATWKKLCGGAAGLYFGGMLKAAGEEHWKNRKALVQAALAKVGPGVQKIRELVSTLLDASRSYKNIRVSIVGDGMRFKLSIEDQDEAIDTVARSVHLMHQIRKCVDEIKDRIEDDNHIYGTVNVTFDDDGFTINWVTKAPWRFFERKYDQEGKPKGDAYAVWQR